MLSGKGIIYNRCPSQIHKPCTGYFKQTTHVKVIILKYENAYSSITRVKVFFFFLVTCICLTMNQCYIFASICECVKLIQIRLSTCIHMKSKLLQTVSYKGKLVVK